MYLPVGLINLPHTAVNCVRRFDTIQGFVISLQFVKAQSSAVVGFEVLRIDFDDLGAELLGDVVIVHGEVRSTYVLQ